MPNSFTNSIKFQLTFIKDSLNNVASKYGGIAVIARDYMEMWEIASNTPGPKAVVVYDGEDIRGPQEWAAAMSRVDRKYTVLISRGTGFTAHRADTLTQEVMGTEAYFDLLEEFRDTIRVLIFDPGVTEANPDDKDPIDYHGMEAVQIDGYPIDAYLIKFSIGTQLGTPLAQSAVVLTGPPNPPSQLNLIDNGSSVTLLWTINSPNTTATVIQRSDDNGVTYSTIGTVGQGIVTYTDSTVLMGNVYYYRVYNNSTTGDSQPSNIVNILV